MSESSDEGVAIDLTTPEFESVVIAQLRPIAERLARELAPDAPDRAALAIDDALRTAAAVTTRCVMAEVYNALNAIGSPVDFWFEDDEDVEGETDAPAA